LTKTSDDELINLSNNTIEALKTAKDKCLKGKKKELDEIIWESSFDVEYCLFLMSLKRDYEERRWKIVIDEDNISILISKTINCLETALEIIESDSDCKAYQQYWYARRYLLKIQRVLELS
jgi:hypothetical protein